MFIDEDEAIGSNTLGDGGGYGVAFVFDFGRVFDTDLGCCGVNAGFISRLQLFKADLAHC